MPLETRIVPGTHTDARIAVLAFEGELDQTTAPSMHREVQRVFAKTNATTVILDVSALTYINSYGVGSILALDVHHQRARQRLVLAGAQGIVFDVLTLVGLPQIIPSHPTVDDALEALRTHSVSAHA